MYDVTPFLYEHPGGEDIILKATGKILGSLLMKLNLPLLNTEDAKWNETLWNYL